MQESEREARVGEKEQGKKGSDCRERRQLKAQGEPELLALDWHKFLDFCSSGTLRLFCRGYRLKSEGGYQPKI